MSRAGGHPSRRRVEIVEHVEAIARELDADPTLTANEIIRRIGGRRRDVLRLVKAIKRSEVGRAVASRPIGSETPSRSREEVGGS